LPKRGQDKRYLMSKLSQLSRQAATNVAQAASLAKRYRFGSSKEDIHEWVFQSEIVDFTL